MFYIVFYYNQVKCFVGGSKNKRQQLCLLLNNLALSYFSTNKQEDVVYRIELSIIVLFPIRMKKRDTFYLHKNKTISLPA